MTRKLISLVRKKLRKPNVLSHKEEKQVVILSSRETRVSNEEAMYWSFGYYDALFEDFPDTNYQGNSAYRSGFEEGTRKLKDERIKTYD